MKDQSKNSLQHGLYVSLALTMSLGSNALLAAEVCDIDGNNIISQNDIELIFQRKNSKATIPFDPMDIDRNGVIDTNDARLCVCKLPTTADCSIPLNQAPFANAGADQNLGQIVFSTINLDGGLSGDPDSDSLSYLWGFQQKPEGSSATLSGLKTVRPSFIPDRFGTYILSLVVTDGFGEKSSASFITLALSNPSPLAANADISTTVAGGEIITGNLLGNDVITNREVSLAPLFSNASTPAGGIFSLQNNGNYTYIPPQIVDTAIEEVLTYVITGLDGKQSSSTLTIKVNPNAPLQAVADSRIAQAGREAVTGNLLSNDVFGDRTINLSPLLANFLTPKGGVISLQDDGSYTYIPPQSVDTTIEEVLSYTITGLDGKQSTSTLTITTSPNLPLEAQADTNTVQAGGVTATGNVLNNDVFNNRTISVSPLLTDLLTPEGGVFSLENNGNYSYTPPQSVNGVRSENITYTITGLDGKQSNSTLTITINPPAPLEARNDTSTVQAGGAATIGNILDNDAFDNQIVNITPLLANVSTPKGGLFSLQNDGRYTYLPPQDINAGIEESVSYTITGLDGRQSSAVLTIIVNVNNRLPLARSDSNSVTANGAAVSGNVLGNDDRGNQPTQVTSALSNVQTPLGGIFSLQADGNYTYMPPKNVAEVKQEQFNYTIVDIDGETSTSTLTITINPENRQPAAQPDLASATAGGSAITGNVLTNDDLGNQPTKLTGAVSNIQTPLGGVFTLAENGVYTYAPPSKITGVATEKVDYTITDVDGESSTATLTIRVSPENLVPLANPDSNNATAGGAVVTGSVLANDTQGNAPVSASLTSSSPNNVGSLDLKADGSYRYTPPSTVSGIVNDMFTYTITDQDGDTSTSTLTVQVGIQNLTPLANPDSNNATAGGAVVTGSVLTNDTQGNAPVSASLTSSNPNNVGSLDLKADGSYRYTPPSTVSGIVNDIFTYTITDQDGESSTSTLTVQVGIQNLTPLANPDSNNATAGGAVVTGSVLTNDTQGNAPVSASLTSSNPNNVGSLDLKVDGSYRYTPPSTVSGIVNDIFTYTITDQDGESSTSTLTVQVGIQNLTPLANPDSNNATASGAVVTGSVLANDTQGNAPVLASLTSSNPNNVGSLDLKADGSYSYTPPSTVSGIVNDIFTYTITDQDGESSTSTLTISVSPQNLTPKAEPDTNNATAGGAAVKGSVLINDTQGNGSVLTSLTSSNPNNVGSLDLKADGSYSYIPPSTVSGVVNDIFTYTITDQDGDSSTSTLTISVSPQNLTPKAEPDINNATVSQSADGVEGNVLSNDVLGNAPTTVTPIVNTSTQSTGALNLQANGDYNYLPPSISNITTRFTESFQYTITDNDNETSTSTLTINIDPSCRAIDDTQNEVEALGSLSGNVTTNDIFCTNPISVTEISIQETLAGGTFILSQDGGFTYTAPTSVTAEREERFTYTITDNKGDTSSATLVITVKPEPFVVQ